MNEEQYYNTMEENIYQESYIQELMDDDALSSEEAGFLQGYNS